MKKTSLILFFSVFSLFVFSQEQNLLDAKTNSIKETKVSQTKENDPKNFNNKENDHIFIPTLIFSRLGVGAGVDFMYRKRNGFAMFINLNLAVPFTAPLGGIIATTEVYFGYAIKKGGFYAVFSAGPWVGGGVSFYAYTSPENREAWMRGPFEAYTSIMFALSFRNDFMYFFNSKVGINFSHTHAVGAHTADWGDDLMVIHYKGNSMISLYYFMLKLGIAIKV